MNPENKIIPHLLEDMGEGIMNPLEESPKGLYPEADAYQDYVQDYVKTMKEVTEKKAPPRRRILMQLGMSIHFQGYEYRVTKVLKRGRIMLKFMGELPDSTA